MTYTSELPWNAAQVVLHTVWAQTMAAFLAGLVLFGDEQRAAAFVLPTLHAQALLWLDGELTRIGLTDCEVHSETRIRW